MKNLANVVNIPNARLNKYKPKIKASRMNAPLNIGAGKCLANQKYAHLATIITSSKRLIISVKSHVPPILSLMDI